MVEYLEHLTGFPVIYQHRPGTINPHFLFVLLPILCITSYSHHHFLSHHFLSHHHFLSSTLPIRLIISYLITSYPHDSSLSQVLSQPSVSLLKNKVPCLVLEPVL